MGWIPRFRPRISTVQLRCSDTDPSDSINEFTTHAGWGRLVPDDWFDLLRLLAGGYRDVRFVFYWHH